LPANVVRIPFEEAVSKLASSLKVRNPEQVSVYDSLGRRLSVDVVSSWPVPRFDVSHMDGYAVRSADLAGASKASPVSLKITGLSRPDGLGPLKMEPGTCVRVLTGGRLPSGADAVVTQEAVERTDGSITVRETVEPKSHVHEAGSDVGRGLTLFRRGHILNARDVSFLLSYGQSTVAVSPSFRVGMLATGSELTEHEAGPVEGKVVETNRMVLREALEACSFSVEDLGLARDDAEDIAFHLKRADGSCDAILTTGGSSVSEADLVPDAIEMLGGVRIFHGLLLRPSRTLGAYLIGETPVFLLSGLIQGAISAYCNVVYPSLRFMAGDGWEPLPSVKARLSRAVVRQEKDKFRSVTWVHMTAEGGQLIAEPTAAPSTTRYILTKASGFLVGDPGQGFKEGELVDVRLAYGFGLEDALAGR
jgi:molybdenum cofactor synthesis domain-containing protein